MPSVVRPGFTPSQFAPQSTSLEPGYGSASFPIGSIFLTVLDQEPRTLLGYGTWTRFGEGKFLVSYSSGETEFDSVLETGGTKTHTHTL